MVGYRKTALGCLLLIKSFTEEITWLYLKRHQVALFQSVSICLQLLLVALYCDEDCQIDQKQTSMV